MASKNTRVKTDKKMSLNRIVLLIFSFILILIGILGFVIPAQLGVTSGEAGYNYFHLIAGFTGIVFWLANKERAAETFNIVFGLIELYQALASYLHLFPEQYFRWTKTDDVLHIVIGLLLIAVGFYGAYNRHNPKKNIS